MAVFCLGVFLSGDDEDTEENDESAYSLGDADSFPEEIIVGHNNKNHRDGCDEHRDTCGALCKMGDFQECAIDEDKKETGHECEASP